MAEVGTSSSSCNDEDSSISSSDSCTSSEKQDISSLPKETMPGHFPSGQLLPREKKTVRTPAPTSPETVRTLLFIVTSPLLCVLGKCLRMPENTVPLASHPTHSEYYSAPISAGLLRLQQ